MDVTHTVETTHTLTVAPYGVEGDLVFEERRVQVEKVAVKVTLDSDGRLLNTRTEYVATVWAFRSGDKPAARAATMRGNNLNRLPATLLDAILDAVDALGITGLREDLDKIATRSMRERLAAERQA